LTQIETRVATTHAGAGSSFKPLICLGVALVALAAAADPAPAGQPAPAASESSRLDRLEARQEIEELFAQYGATLDRRDFDSFGRLFTEDAVYGAGPTPAHGRAAIQAQLQQTLSANPMHLPGPDFHLSFSPSIHVEGDHATAHSLGTYLIPDIHSPSGWKMIFLVSYDDTLVRRNGHWLFQQRLLHAAAPAAAVPDTLDDHEAIERLLMEYGRAVDNRDWAAFAALFAPDGEWQGAQGAYHGPEQIQQSMQKVFSSPAAAADIPKGSNFHVMTNPIIDVKGDHAMASSRFIFYKMEHGKPVATVAGRYEDTLIRIDGVWKFQQRRALPPG